jgi:Fe-S cluster assembly scaffold protein SufB
VYAADAAGAALYQDTFAKLGIPEAERKFLAGVSAHYESEVVYHSIREDQQKQGRSFLDMDSGLRAYPDLVKDYFGTVIPAADNQFSALNSAVWSDSLRCRWKVPLADRPPIVLAARPQAATRVPQALLQWRLVELRGAR